MNTVLIFGLGFFVILGYHCISGTYIYPSIHWFPQNPLFIADGDTCGSGPRKLKVELQSTVYFICPNTATVLQKSSVGIQPADMYENLWLLYNETAFDRCDASLDPDRRRLLLCETPGKLKFSSVQFALVTAEQDGLTFKAGQSYYFIATSDGKESHLNSTSGGHCNDSVNKIYMKIEVYVCDNQDPECNNTDVGELKCPNIRSATPSSSITSSTIETPITTTSLTKEIYTTGSLQSSKSTTASGATCIPSVTTKTVSSEGTKVSVSCADVCNKVLASESISTKTVTTTEMTSTTASGDICIPSVTTKTISSEVTKSVSCAEVSDKALSSTIASTTEMSTKTVYSTVIPAETVQASESISTKTVTTTEITTKTVVRTSAVPIETLIQVSGSLSREATPASDFSSQTVSSAIKSTNKSVSNAVTFTKTVSTTALFTDLCDRCFSLSTQFMTSSITANEDNGSQQLPKQDKLSNDKEDSNSEEMWMTAAIIFLVLFCLALIIISGLAFKIKNRKACLRYSNRVAPENGTEMNLS